MWFSVPASVRALGKQAVTARPALTLNGRNIVIVAIVGCGIERFVNFDVFLFVGR